MTKRFAVTISDDTHAQIKERAAEAGVSVHAWMVAALEREAYRQLLEKANKWWAEHPEQGAQYEEDYRRRQAARARTDADRGSSAA